MTKAYPINWPRSKAGPKLRWNEGLRDAVGHGQLWQFVHGLSGAVRVMRHKDIPPRNGFNNFDGTDYYRALDEAALLLMKGHVLVELHQTDRAESDYQLIISKGRLEQPVKFSGRTRRQSPQFVQTVDRLRVLLTRAFSGASSFRFHDQTYEPLGDSSDVFTQRWERLDNHLTLESGYNVLRPHKKRQ